MKIKDMIDWLQERYAQEDIEFESEILVEDEDGTLCDFTIEDTEEAFDGFDTFYPAGLKIVVKHESGI